MSKADVENLKRDIRETRTKCAAMVASADRQWVAASEHLDAIERIMRGEYDDCDRPLIRLLANSCLYEIKSRRLQTKLVEAENRAAAAMGQPAED